MQCFPCNALQSNTQQFGWIIDMPLRCKENNIVTLAGCNSHSFFLIAQTQACCLLKGNSHQAQRGCMMLGFCPRLCPWLAPEHLTSPLSCFSQSLLRLTFNIRSFFQEVPEKYVVVITPSYWLRSVGIFKVAMINKSETLPWEKRHDVWANWALRRGPR